MKNDRLFRILYILLERQSITAPALANLLEVSIRTVYRDVESLSMAGIPVQTTSGRSGGISLMPGYNFQKALLSEEEQDQLMLGLQTLGGLHPTGLGALTDKLQGMFRRQTADWLQVDLSRWGHGQADSAKFDVLKNAILQRQVLRICYYGASGQRSQREILPYKLLFKDKSWYLQAFCRSAAGYRLFRLPRIAAQTPTGEYFQMDFSDAPPADAPGPPPPPESAIILRFSKNVTYRLFDEFEPEDMEPQQDGSVLVKTFFPIDSWVYGYLLGYGTEVEVLSPPFLRQALAEQAKEIFERHKP